MQAAIRIRGSFRVKRGIEAALSHHLHLTRGMHCVVFKRDVSSQLQKAKDYITWSEVDEEIVKKLSRRKEAEGRDYVLFRLHPPRGGFKKSTKLPFPRGELGKRDADSMKKLLERMV
ncbi:hypothetical protein HY571_02345 [Candidatus Micrarchaeota archaeon]|nr:hypothetical protein [Candidatus Micrarchaeota archaeon]